MLIIFLGRNFFSFFLHIPIFFPNFATEKLTYVMKKIFFFLFLLPLLVSCEDKEQKAVDTLMEEIRQQYADGEDSVCIRSIDTLRARHPKAAEARREALGIYQQASLRLAQNRLAKVDEALLAAQAKYKQLDSLVSAHKAEGIATEEEFTSHTLQRILCDSLQTQFDVLCAEIRYIKKRQEMDK